MKLYRIGGIGAGVLAATLALAACGSDNNTAGDTSSSGGSGTSAAAPKVACPSGSGSLTAEGSTAQANAMDQWITDYKTVCPDQAVTYNGTGSGAGITNFTGGQVDFAGSDSALDPAKGETDKAKTRCGSDAYNLPMVTGPIAVAFKLSGVKDLTLTPSVISKMFLGQITTWNDPAIKALNSGATLPATAVTVFFRSDDSGTTQNFETYLHTAAPTDFAATPSKTWAGKVGQGVKGSAGIQQGVQSTDGGIGYVEYSFAQNGALSVAKVDNGGGAVELTTDSAAKAVEAAKVVGTNGDLTLKLDYATKVSGAYPIVLVTYEVACSKYSDAAKGSAVKAFLTYTSGKGQEALADLGYAPLPTAIATQVQASVAKIS